MKGTLEKQRLHLSRELQKKKKNDCLTYCHRCSVLLPVSIMDLWRFASVSVVEFPQYSVPQDNISGNLSIRDLLIYHEQSPYQVALHIFTLAIVVALHSTQSNPLSYSLYIYLGNFVCNVQNLFSFLQNPCSHLHSTTVRNKVLLCPVIIWSVPLDKRHRLLIIHGGSVFTSFYLPATY